MLQNREKAAGKEGIGVEDCAQEEKERQALENAYAGHDWARVAQLAEQIILRHWPDCTAPGLSRVYYYAAMSLVMQQATDEEGLSLASWWIGQALSLPQSPAGEMLLSRVLGDVNISRHDYVAARAALKRCLCAFDKISLPPGDMLERELKAGALMALAHVEGYLGDNVAGRDHYLAAARLFGDLPQRYAAYSSALHSEHFFASGNVYGVQVMNELHRGVNAIFADIKPLPAMTAASLRERQHRRLRIGYISGDFRQHVMYQFYSGLLRGHDARRFELYAYSLGQVHDVCTDSVAAAVEHFIDMEDVAGDYAAIAQRVREDEIDILVDLSGHCTLSGLPVLAYRPAPVQLSGIGYIHQTGMEAVDGFLTDGYTAPWEYLADWESLYEAPVRLRSQFCYVRDAELPCSTGAPCRKNGYITWGVFNRYEKITDDMLDAWQEILCAVPESRLLLKNLIAASSSGQRLMQRRLQEHGIDSARVQIENVSSNYMERYLDVDIALDTYPYVGGGTTCDALYMGVPVITRYGRRYGTRLGLSILCSAGIGELAAATMQEYIARAVQLAQDQELLNVLHIRLRQMLRSSPLMDVTRYVGEIETLYEWLWQQRIVK